MNIFFLFFSDKCNSSLDFLFSYDAKKDLQNTKADIIVIGNGNKVIDQYPSKNTILVDKNKVYLITNDDNILMPSVIGWSRNDIIRLCKMLNIDYKINGSGYVVTQSIPPNGKVSGILEVTLQNKE